METAAQEIDFGAEVSKAKNPNKPLDLNSMLSDYSEPAKMNVEQSEQTTPGASAPITKETHYVKGPKKGQPKPNAKIGVSVTPPKSDGEISGNNILTGALFLMLLDMFIPFIIAMVNNRFSKQKIDVKLLQLHPDQRKALEPIADKVIEQVKLKGNPLIIFVVSYLGMMAMNFMLAKTISK